MTQAGAHGTMQRWPLLVTRFVDHAARWHADVDVIARRADGSMARSNWGVVADRARRLATRLVADGVRRGDRVATLGSNSLEQLVAWYGIIGAGAVCHTLNPRLHGDTLVQIARHAGDRRLLVDASHFQVALRLQAECPAIGALVLLDGKDDRAPTFDDFIGDCVPVTQWQPADEEDPVGLCYTSGTTGSPKGVTYTHRSNYLHTLASGLPDAFALSASDRLLPIVPLYHANAWGLAFSAPSVGAALVLPGARLDGASLLDLVLNERVTFAAGVPTVMRTLLDEVHRTGDGVGSLSRVVIGGAPCPATLRDGYEAIGVEVRHAWGMTELSPVGLVNVPTPAKIEANGSVGHQLEQGRVTGIDARIVDQTGSSLAHDGCAVGHLQVRGPAVVKRYFGADAPATTEDGWFDTGDMATVDAFGFVRITDRFKDVIKSGGEWISPAEIEAIVAASPAIAAVAVVARRDPKWDERPVLFFQSIGDPTPDADAIAAMLRGRVPDWWLPDAVWAIQTMPLGATGKIDKAALRALAEADLAG